MSKRTFTQLDFTPGALSAAKAQEDLQRWGLRGLKYARFRYTGPFNDEWLTSESCVILVAADLVVDVLSCPKVVAALGGAIEPPANPAVAALSTRALSMDLLDPFFGGTVASKTGIVRQCLERRVHGVPADDELRKYVLRTLVADADAQLGEFFASGVETPDDDVDLSVDDDLLPEVLAVEDRRELLYQLFAMLNAAGSVCQHDLTLEPYLAMTKALYHDVATVYRKASDGEVAIRTRAFKVYSPAVHPKPQFTLVLVEPAPVRTATVLVVDPKAWW